MNNNTTMLRLEFQWDRNNNNTTQYSWWDITVDHTITMGDSSSFASFDQFEMECSGFHAWLIRGMNSLVEEQDCLILSLSASSLASIIIGIIIRLRLLRPTLTPEIMVSCFFHQYHDHDDDGERCTLVYRISTLSHPPPASSFSLKISTGVVQDGW